VSGHRELGRLVVVRGSGGWVEPLMDVGQAAQRLAELYAQGEAHVEARAGLTGSRRLADWQRDALLRGAVAVLRGTRNGQVVATTTERRQP